MEYAGSDRCRECHETMYEGWKETFHATVIQDAKKNPEAVLGDFTEPGIGFSLGDVEFTIGGHWDQRYMKKIGNDYFVLPKLWSVQSRTWRPYNVWSWRKKPYRVYCKGCHVTAYDPKANVQVAENRIGCEACHGPGWAHAESGGEKSIIHPGKLPEDRKDMVCAACHVRGTDPTGEFYFPVGFIPGEDLGRYYVPADKKPEESNTQAILRGFGKWKDDRASGGKSKCDVCGIPGQEPKAGEEKDEAVAFCLSCHDIKDRIAEHTHHPAATEIACFDCHVQQVKEVMNLQDRNIHSYSYFLVHAENCYDPRIDRTCVKCHEGKGEEWARATVERWRAPKDIDH